MGRGRWSRARSPEAVAVAVAVEVAVAVAVAGMTVVAGPMRRFFVALLGLRGRCGWFCLCPRRGSRLITLQPPRELLSNSLLLQLPLCRSCSRRRCRVALQLRRGDVMMHLLLLQLLPRRRCHSIALPPLHFHGTVVLLLRP